MERKWQQVTIEGDALHVVQALGNLQGGSSSGSNFLVEDIKSNLRNFVSSKVSHVHRTANIAVHRMTKLALISNFTNCWLEEAPEI